MTIEKLIDEWTEAENGFSAGVDFKTWLAGELIAAREFAEKVNEAECRNCGGRINSSSGYRICENGCGGECTKDGL